MSDGNLWEVQDTSMVRVVFKSDTVYKLNEDWADLYSEVDDFNPNGIRYDHAKSVQSCDGCFISDCWICDEYGNIHPGYKESPVPVYIRNLTISKFKKRQLGG